MMAESYDDCIVPTPQDLSDFLTELNGVEYGLGHIELTDKSLASSFVNRSFLPTLWFEISTELPKSTSNQVEYTGWSPSIRKAFLAMTHKRSHSHSPSDEKTSSLLGRILTKNFSSAHGSFSGSHCAKISGWKDGDVVGRQFYERTLSFDSDEEERALARADAMSNTSTPRLQTPNGKMIPSNGERGAAAAARTVVYRSAPAAAAEGAGAGAGARCQWGARRRRPRPALWGPLRGVTDFQVTFYTDSGEVVSDLRMTTKSLVALPPGAGAPPPGGAFFLLGGRPFAPRGAVPPPPPTPTPPGGGEGEEEGPKEGGGEGEEEVEAVMRTLSKISLRAAAGGAAALPGSAAAAAGAAGGAAAGAALSEAECRAAHAALWARLGGPEGRLAARGRRGARRAGARARRRALRRQRAALARAEARAAAEDQALAREVAGLRAAARALAAAAERAARAEERLVAGRAALGRTLFLLRCRRAKLAEQLRHIYPIEHSGQGNYNIRGIEIPSDLSQLWSREDEQIGTALGFICHILLMLSKYLMSPLPYRILYNPSRSMIYDHLTHNIEFPLYKRGAERERFERGLALLDRDLDALLCEQGLYQLAGGGGGLGAGSVGAGGAGAPAPPLLRKLRELLGWLGAYYAADGSRSLGLL